MSDTKRHLVNIVAVNNPLDMTDREFFYGELSAPKAPISEIFPDTQDYSNIVVAVNGIVVKKEDFGSFNVIEGDCISVVPVARGGGGGRNKGILRIIAFIALAAVAGPLAGFIGNAMGGVGTIGLGLIKAGIMVAGGLLINALLPIKPVMPQQGDTSTTYGIDGPKNTGRTGVPVPAIYGNTVHSGNRIGLHVENAGNTQFLYMLFAVAEGPIMGISNIKVNGQPIENYADFNIEIRTGTTNQSVIPWFNSTIVPHSLGSILSSSTWIGYTTFEPVDRLRLDFVFPYGLFRLDGDGNAGAIAVDIIAEYRPVGSAEPWIPLTNTHYVKTWKTVYVYYEHGEEVRYNALKSPSHEIKDSYYDPRSEHIVYVSDPNIDITYDTVPDRFDSDQTDPQNIALKEGLITYHDADMGLYQFQTLGYTLRVPSTFYDGISFNLSQRTPVRRSVLSDVLPLGVYEVRFKRAAPEGDNTTSIFDRVQLDTVNEIINDTIQYNGTALLGLKIRLSDQLNSLPNVTYVVSGKICKVRRMVNGAPVWSNEWTNNPAWVTYDILTGEMGGQIPEENIDIDKWQEWADFCNENGFFFNGTFDDNSNIWDACQVVFRIGHAQLVQVGAKYSLAIDGPTVPSMMFSSVNTIEGTVQTSWLPMSDRANEIEVTYWEEKDYYQRHVIRIVDDSVQSLEPQRSVGIELKGCTNREQAVKEGWFHLNMNRLIRQTITFDAPLDALALTVGDVFYFQSEVAEWNTGGRFEDGSTTDTLNLDREVYVPTTTETPHSILVHYDQVVRFSAPVHQVVGSYVTFIGYDGNKSVRKLIVGADEYDVIRVIKHNNRWGVQIDPDHTVVAGDAAQLIDMDALVERTVALPGTGNTSSVTLSSPLPYAPTKYMRWAYGPQSLVKKPYRVISITGGGTELTRKVTAVEYVEEVYTFPSTAVSSQPLLNYGVISQVRNLRAYETLTRAGNSFITNVTLLWDVPLYGNYAGADVFAKFNGEDDWRYMGVVRNGQVGFTHIAQDGDNIVYKVVAFDFLGNRMTFATSASYNYIVAGKTTPPPDVPTFFINLKQGGIRQFGWHYPNPPVDLAGFKIKYALGSTTDWTIMEPLHTGLITISPYETTRLPRGTYNFAIKAVDTTGNESVNATYITATLPDPAFDNALYVFEESDTGWSGIKTDCHVDSSTGYLVGDSTASTWTDLPTTWSDWTSWNLNPITQFQYEQEYDLGVKIKFIPLIETTTINGTSTITVSHSDDGVTWSAYASVIGEIDARYVRVRAVINGITETTSPVLTGMNVAITADIVTEDFQDVSMATMSGSVGDRRLPLTKTFRLITRVDVVLQGVGPQHTWTLVDKDGTIGAGPRFKVYNGTTPTDVIIDATVRGI